jgi:DnaD/phage-associated family protein
VLAGGLFREVKLQFEGWISVDCEKEFGGFRDWALRAKPSTGELTLWYALFALACASCEEEFSASSQTLEILTGLSRSGLDRARKQLVEKGRITYRAGSGRTPAAYSVVAFERPKVGSTPYVTSDVTVDNTVDVTVDSTVDVTVDNTVDNTLDSTSGMRESPVSSYSSLSTKDLSTSTSTRNKDLSTSTSNKLLLQEYLISSTKDLSTSTSTGTKDLSTSAIDKDLNTQVHQQQQQYNTTNKNLITSTSARDLSSSPTDSDTSTQVLLRQQRARVREEIPPQPFERDEEGFVQIKNAIERATGRFATEFQVSTLHLFSLDDGLDLELVLRAIEQSALAGKDIRYAVSILRSWREKGIHTVAQADLEQEEFRRREVERRGKIRGPYLDRAPEEPRDPKKSITGGQIGWIRPASRGL